MAKRLRNGSRCPSSMPSDANVHSADIHSPISATISGAFFRAYNAGIGLEMP